MTKDKIIFIKKSLQIIIIILPLLFLILIAATKHPEPWHYFLKEISPLSWLQSLMLYSIAVISLIIISFNYIRANYRNIWLWLLWACAFFYLMLDERFAIHERFRDIIFAPLKIKLPVFFWTENGDFILLLLFCLSCIYLCIFIKSISINYKQKYLLLTAFCFSAFAIALDSYPFQKISLLLLCKAQMLEELFETLALSFFLIFCIEYFVSILISEIDTLKAKYLPEYFSNAP
jgi:hypothetical protein